jgi:hypothetical protein
MGRFEMEDIMASPGLDNLHIIEAGPIPANPSELLSTPAMGEFLRAVREEYDIVLIDTPPVLPVTDSTIVAGQVDAVVLVYQAGKVGRLVLKRAKIHLESARAKVLGVVLNDVQTEVAGYQYAHYYTHYYGEEAGAPEPAQSGLSRVWGRIRSKFSRGQQDEYEVEPEPANGEMEASPDDARVAVAEGGDDDKPRRKRGYRNTTMGLIVLVGLAGALGGVVAWRTGKLGGAQPPHPREAFRERLESRAADKMPPAPAAIPAAVTPPGPAARAAQTAPAPVPAPAPVAAAPGVDGPSVVTPAPAAPAAPPASAPAARAAVPAAPPPAAKPAAPAAPAPVAAPPPAAAATPSETRFGIEVGPFHSVAEAEDVERKLNQAGYRTVRLRQQNGTSTYAVLIEKIPTAKDAETLTATLKEQGFADATVTGGNGAPLAVRAGEPLPLRGAVRLAERLRGLGHAVRVASQPGEASSFVVRHGSYPTREEAGEKGEELKRLGLATQIVRVR